MTIILRRERDLNPRIRGFADLAIRPLWYRATGYILADLDRFELERCAADGVVEADSSSFFTHLVHAQE